MDILEKELENIGVPFKFFQVQCEDGSSQKHWMVRMLIAKLTVFYIYTNKV